MKRKHSALTINLMKEIRSKGKDSSILAPTVEDIFTERATAVNTAGYEDQIETIIAAEGVDEGVALIRKLIAS